MALETLSTLFLSFGLSLVLLSASVQVLDLILDYYDDWVKWLSAPWQQVLSMLFFLVFCVVLPLGGALVLALLIVDRVFP